jgi:methionyl-tRNA formyltransferase
MSAVREGSPRIVLAGSVGSTRRTLEALLRHGANLIGVLELTEEAAAQVSGFTRLSEIAAAAGVPCVAFRNINAPEVYEQVRDWQPDLLFVVGLSQLVKPELLALPRRACVGFHPTHLPKGRGRAPVAWLALDGASGAATFFEMDDGADSGPILAQEPFPVTGDDYAEDVVRNIESAIDRALDRWLPKLLTGEWNPAPQDDGQATYFAKRGPEDGLIDWGDSAERIYALIRAASRPHPGAYTYFRRRKAIIWRAEVERNIPFRGVVGRVLTVDPARGALVQCGEGLLWLTEVEAAIPAEAEAIAKIGVGVKLGYVVEDELAKLHQTIVALQERVATLEAQLNPSREPAP